MMQCRCPDPNKEVQWIEDCGCDSSPYHEIDHTHCWEEENPPCGQKIKHYECCLCKKKNPN